MSEPLTHPVVVHTLETRSRALVKILTVPKTWSGDDIALVLDFHGDDIDHVKALSDRTRTRVTSIVPHNGEAGHPRIPPVELDADDLRRARERKVATQMPIVLDRFDYEGLGVGIADGLKWAHVLLVEPTPNGISMRGVPDPELATELSRRARGGWPTRARAQWIQDLCAAEAELLAWLMTHDGNTDRSLSEVLDLALELVTEGRVSQALKLYEIAGNVLHLRAYPGG